MKKFIAFLASILVFIITINSHAQTSQGNPMEGSKTYPTGLDLGQCRLNLFTIGYRLGILKDQVSVYSNIKWKGQDPSSTCLSNTKFEIFLSIGNETTPRYIYAGSSAGLIVGAGNNEWGIHPYSSSVTWNKLVTKNFGAADRLQFASAEEAREIWKRGFVVKVIKLVTSEGKVYILK